MCWILGGGGEQEEIVVLLRSMPHGPDPRDDPLLTKNFNKHTVHSVNANEAMLQKWKACPPIHENAGRRINWPIPQRTETGATLVHTDRNEKSGAAEQSKSIN